MKKFDIRQVHNNTIIYRNGKKPLEVFFPKFSEKDSRVITIDEKGDVNCHNIKGEYFNTGKECEFDLFFSK